jgi:dihydrofolate reductase
VIEGVSQVRLLAAADGQPVHPGAELEPEIRRLQDAREALPRSNSSLLAGDAAEAVAALKEQPGGDLVVLGSGELVKALVPHGVIDGYVLLIHPLVLGRGRRLFSRDGARAALRLVDVKASPSGVVIATYRSGAEDE